MGPKKWVLIHVGWHTILGIKSYAYCLSDNDLLGDIWQSFRDAYKQLSVYYSNWKYKKIPYTFPHMWAIAQFIQNAKVSRTLSWVEQGLV